MKDKEKYIGLRLAEIYPVLSPMHIAVDIFSPYDFECPQFLIEIKSRDKFYNPWMIEKIKVTNNIDVATERRKQLLFIFEHNNIAYVFNVNKLIDSNYDFKWETRNLPASTEFGKKNWLPKEVGYFDIEYAVKVNL
jgi:hypothetical protein